MTNPTTVSESKTGATKMSIRERSPKRTSDSLTRRRPDGRLPLDLRSPLLELNTISSAQGSVLLGSIIDNGNLILSNNHYLTKQPPRVIASVHGPQACGGFKREYCDRLRVEVSIEGCEGVNGSVGADSNVTGSNSNVIPEQKVLEHKVREYLERCVIDVERKEYARKVVKVGVHLVGLRRDGGVVSVNTNSNVKSSAVTGNLNSKASDEKDNQTDLKQTPIQQQSSSSSPSSNTMSVLKDVAVLPMIYNAAVIALLQAQIHMKRTPFSVGVAKISSSSINSDINSINSNSSNSLIILDPTTHELQKSSTRWLYCIDTRGKIVYEERHGENVDCSESEDGPDHQTVARAGIKVMENFVRVSLGKWMSQKAV